MKVLICIRSYWFFKNTAPLLKEVLARGHDLVLLITTIEEAPSERNRLAALEVEAAIEQMRTSYPNFEVRRARERRDVWTPIVNGVRRAIDLAHLLQPRFDSKPRIRQRAVDRAPVPMAAIALRAKKTGRLPKLAKILTASDGRIPAERRMVDLLREIGPDVLVITPLISLGCNQNEILRAAAELDLPTLFMVHSWDNLSAKSPLRCRPTCMAVWNEVQRREAVDYHGFPAGKVALSGAPHFDEWRDRRPQRTREAFMRELGFDPESTLVTYVCSTVFDFHRLKEQDFVRRWLRGLRASSHAALQRTSIIVRVHPQRVQMADEFLEPDDERIVVWPRRTTAPVGEAAKDDYLSSLLYADAVVGINTTAMVEAAYLGRPVLTILGTEFAASQDGTFHFAYLTNNGSGMIRAATSMDEHYAQLADAVSGEKPFSSGEKAYVEMFVRPQGEQSSTAKIADIVEETAHLGVEAAEERIAPQPLGEFIVVVAAISGIQLIHLVYRAAVISRLALRATFNRMRKLAGTARRRVRQT